ncbi:MAG: hypothetical protein WBL61_03495 [Bryobacteraceae bacterium]
MATADDLLDVRFRLNMQRVGGLTALLYPGSIPLTPAVVESESVRADLFRTIVVFLHATFEDILRTAARERLGAAPPQVLKDIPLIGISKFRRAEKFHLGHLSAHRGKTVDQLIQESVQRHLDRESFGSCADVDETLNKMGVDTTPFKSLYGDLDQMMKRRHRIVHEADLPGPQHSATSQWTIADNYQLCLWNLAVVAFYSLLRVSLDPANELQLWCLERRVRAAELVRQSREEMIALRGQSPESMMSGIQNSIETLAQATAALGPPSHEELLALHERIEAKKTES